MSTRPGWIGRTEVVEVRFDPALVSYDALVEHAKARRCISPVFTRTKKQQDAAQKIVGTAARRTDDAIRWVKDNKYQLGRTPLRFVPMTRMQATRINADVKNAARWLSPRQKQILAQATRHPDGGWPVQIGVALRDGWKRADAVAAKLR